MKVMELPANFDPAYTTATNQQLLDPKKMLTKDKNTSKIMIYNGIFYSHQYFIDEIGKLINGNFTHYHSDVETIYNEIKNSIVQSAPSFTNTGDGRWYQSYGTGINSRFNLRDKFSWQIFNFKFQNSYSAAANVTRCTINLNNTNITIDDIRKSIKSDNSYEEREDGETSDIELWIKCKRGNENETRWNKLSKNTKTNYDGTDNFKYIDRKYNSPDSNIRQQTSSLYSIESKSGELNLDVALFYRLENGGQISTNNFMNIYFAVGMRKNELVKKYMGIPKIKKMGNY